MSYPLFWALMVFSLFRPYSSVDQGELLQKINRLTENTIIVNTIQDVALDGFCSFREAIVNANSNSDQSGNDCTSGSTADAIHFDIPGNGPFQIKPVSDLPVITDLLTIDGYSQPNAFPAGEANSPSLMIEISGELAGANANGLTLGSGSSFSVIRGLAISGFSKNGILLESGASNVLIEGCYIGTDISGLVAKINDDSIPEEQTGIRVTSGNSKIGGNTPGMRNVISGNFTGIRITGVSASNNDILGNYIGIDINGNNILQNTRAGIHIDRGATFNFIGDSTGIISNVISGNTVGITILTESSQTNTIANNLIGLSADGHKKLPNVIGIAIGRDASNNTIGGSSNNFRNIISGNSSNGVDLTDGAKNNTVQNNYIGLDPGGVVALGNGGNGIYLALARNRDDNPIQRGNDITGNVISGNTFSGILLEEVTTKDNTIENNRIGTSANGLVALGNLRHGIELRDSTTSNIIGRANSGNIISGNFQSGISISGNGVQHNRLRGNIIGADPSGNNSLGNLRNGVFLGGGASNNEIGGLIPEESNLIAYNNEDGIKLEGSETLQNLIGVNEYIANGKEAIDLIGREGFSPNDSEDADEGPNNLQNFPDLNSVIPWNSDRIFVFFETDSPVTESRYPIEIDFYSFQEGKKRYKYLSTQISKIPFSPRNVPIRLQGEMPEFLVALARDAEGNTSEFSDPVRIDMNSSCETPYPTEIDISVDIEFGSVTSKNSYRLAGLPGNDSLNMALILPGKAGRASDWRAFQDNGEENSELLEYNENPQRFVFAPGNGFWLLNKKRWAYSMKVPSVTLTDNAYYELSLHSGYNIISNPFEIDIPWALVLAANDISTNEPLWKFDTRFEISDVFESSIDGTAFYFKNNQEPLTLKVPYLSCVSQENQQFVVKPTSSMKLSILDNGSAVSSVRLGMDKRASESMDFFDIPAPPAYFQSSRIELLSPSLEQKRFFADYRPEKISNVIYELLVSSEKDRIVELFANNMENLSGKKITLFDPRNKKGSELSIDNDTVFLEASAEGKRYEIIISERDQSIENPLPSIEIETQLYTAFPNPFDRVTNINFTLAEPVITKIEIFAANGRKVSTLIDHFLDSGRHQLKWDGTNQSGQPISSGIYFYRLTTKKKVLSGKIAKIR